MKKQQIKALLEYQRKDLEKANRTIAELREALTKSIDANLGYLPEVDPSVQEAFDQAHAFSPWPGKYKKYLRSLMTPLGYEVHLGQKIKENPDE